MSQPNGSAQPVPPEMQAVADRLNAWCAALTEVRPGAVRFRTEVVELAHDGKVEGSVQLWAITRQGPQVFHLPPDLADELAALLVRSATEARSGLTVVRGGGPTIEEGSRP